MIRRKKQVRFFTATPRSAAAAVEFALLAPLLAWLIIGMLEISRAMTVKMILTDAVRKSCQTGIMQGKGNSDIANDVKDIMSDIGFGSTKFNPPSIGSITIVATKPDGTTVSDALYAPTDSRISIQVSIPISSTMWVTSFFTPSTSSQSETLVMKKQ